MMARNPRFGPSRSAVRKTGAGLAAAAVLGGGAIAVAAVAGGHPAGIVAAPAAHTSRFASEGTLLAAALTDWNSSTRSHHMLHAQLVLFSPLSTSMVGGNTGKRAATPSASPTHW